MNLILRKRARSRSEKAEESVETVKAQAEEWVAQTRHGFAEARSKLAAELESARTSLAQQRQALEEAQLALQAERERRAELDRALERERQQRAELHRRLDQARAKHLNQPGRPGPTEETRPEGETAGTRSAGRAAKWEAAKALAAEGISQREIARRLGINRRTVARLIAADEPPRYHRRPRGSMLDPLEPVMRSVLHDRPGIDAASMTEVLREHGYRGSVDLVRRRLRLLDPSSK